MTQAPPVTNITTGFGLSLSGGKYKSNLSIIVNGKIIGQKLSNTDKNEDYQEKGRDKGGMTRQILKLQ
jgi:hypothetical protein